MDRKGQIAIGGLILLAITVIVGAVMLQGSAQNVGNVVNTYTSANVSFTLGANASTSDLTVCGQKNTSAVVIYVPTGDIVFTHGVGTAGNYTVVQGTHSDGYPGPRIYISGLNATWAGAAVNVSCTYQPDGYTEDAGARGMTNLIIIMTALAIAVVGIGYAVKGYTE